MTILGPWPQPKPRNGNRPAALLDPLEIRIFAASHSNCLLIGPDAIVEDALTALTPLFRQAPVFLSGRQPLELPASREATFVVRDVGELTAGEQSALSAWMESAPRRVQVVSTAVAPILPAVEDRSFLASLYYRLNVMTISLGSGPRLVDRGLSPEARHLPV